MPTRTSGKEYTSPTPTEAAGLTRRRFLQTVGVGAAGGLVVAACGNGSNSSTTALPGSTVASTVAPSLDQIQFASMWSDEVPRGVMEAVVGNYVSTTGNPVNMSTTSIEEYKSQIRTFLTADSTPEVLTWFAGERARFFVDRGLILDISDVWENSASNYAPAFKALATTDGKQFFLPSQWYWWGVWYRRSLFEEKGYSVPENWDEFLGLLDDMASDGLSPITIGTRNSQWTSAGWFDYLNMRVNGYDFHVALTAGNESYTDERVRVVFDRWTELLPYFNTAAASFAWQEAVTPMVNNESGLYLMGRFITDAVPEEIRDDMDFFRFPVIDPAAGLGEEAPVDGYFASANSPNPEGAVEFLKYLAGVEAQQEWVSGAGQIAANPAVEQGMYSDLVLRGIQHIEQSDNIAQFYDRDTHPEMAAIGMDGFVEFMANPNSIDNILARLQGEAERIFNA